MKETIVEIIKICDRHADRLHWSMSQLQKHTPFTTRPTLTRLGVLFCSDGEMSTAKHIISSYRIFSMNIILTQKTASISELKRNFSDVLKQADDEAIAILSHNKAAAYLLPAALYENLMNYLEDLEDAKLIQERANGAFIEVTLDEL